MDQRVHLSLLPQIWIVTKEQRSCAVLTDSAGSYTLTYYLLAEEDRDGRELQLPLWDCWLRVATICVNCLNLTLPLNPQKHRQIPSVCVCVRQQTPEGKHNLTHFTVSIPQALYLCTWNSLLCKEHMYTYIHFFLTEVLLGSLDSWLFFSLKTFLLGSQFNMYLFCFTSAVTLIPSL